MIETSSGSGRPARGARSQWWRTVLGEYPTGVVLVTSTDADGAHVGMIVGTFSAVSEDPPMVGFMPSSTSRTLGHITRRGRFVVSVLGARHEQLARDFAASRQDRFQGAEWVTTESGLLRVADAVSWYESSVDQVIEAGDHAIVLGRVEGFGVGNGNGGLPLLYLKGGYGTFTAPSLRLDFGRFGDRMRLTDSMAEVLEEYAKRCGVECTVSTLAGDSVVVLASAGVADPVPRGASFPWAAPLSPVFAAWAGDEQRKVWIERSRHLVGKVDRPRLAALLEGVRSRGYAVSLGTSVPDQFASTVTNPDADRAELMALWMSIEDERATLEKQGSWRSEVGSIQLPVFDTEGRASLELVVGGFGPAPSRERFEEVLAGAQEAAALLSALGAAFES